MESEIPDLIYSALHKKMGHLYVCGDVKMANDVEGAVTRIIAKEGQMTKIEAENWINEMKVCNEKLVQLDMLLCRAPTVCEQTILRRLFVAMPTLVI